MRRAGLKCWTADNPREQPFTSDAGELVDKQAHCLSARLGQLSAVFFIISQRSLFRGSPLALSGQQSADQKILRWPPSLPPHFPTVFQCLLGLLPK